MDKIQSLQHYADTIRTKMQEKIPAKHSGRPEAYRRFLENELRMTTEKIENLKLAPAVGAKK